MRVPVSAPNLAPWLALFALLFFVSGCSHLGDLAGPQSSETDESGDSIEKAVAVDDTLGAFEPVIVDYPEAANHAPEGYRIINIHGKAEGRAHGDDYWWDDYERSWWEWYSGQRWKAVAKRVYRRHGGRIGWNGSGIMFPRGSLPGRGYWMYMMRVDPPEPWIDFGPHGLVFREPVTIRISYANCDLPEGIDPEDFVLFYWNEWTGEYELISQYNNTEEKYVQGETDHFSRYIIAAPEE